MPNTTKQAMNLKNRECSKSVAKTEIISLSKLEQNYNENRDYLKCHSVGILKEKCKLFEGIRGLVATSLLHHKHYIITILLLYQNWTFWTL